MLLLKYYFMVNNFCIVFKPEVIRKILPEIWNTSLTLETNYLHNIIIIKKCIRFINHKKNAL